MCSSQDVRLKTLKSKILTGAMIRDYDLFLHSVVHTDAFIYESCNSLRVNQ